MFVHFHLSTHTCLMVVAVLVCHKTPDEEKQRDGSKSVETYLLVSIIELPPTPQIGVGLEEF
jgi:hypothetical protein